MTRAAPLIQNFNAGELTPLMLGRTETNTYASGARIMENMIALPQGPATTRPAWVLVAEAKYHDKLSRLLSFEFSDEQVYQLEHGDRYIRFFTNRAPIVVAATDAQVVNGDFVTDAANWTDASDAGGSIAHNATDQRLDLIGAGLTSRGIAEQAIATSQVGQQHVVAFDLHGLRGDHIKFAVGTATGLEDIRECVELDAGFHVVAFTPTAGTFHLRFINELSKTMQIDNVTLLNGGATLPAAPIPLELKTPYEEGRLVLLKKAQSWDVMFITARPYRPYKLERRGNTTWSLVEILFKAGPYLTENIDDKKTIQFAATTGDTTATAVGHSPFKPRDIGRLLALRQATTRGYGVITAYQSPTLVDVTVIETVPAGAQVNWRFGLYHDDEGYPAAATFHDERFVMIGPREQPNRADLSATDRFETFGAEDPDDLKDDDPIAVTVAADQVPVLRWGLSQRQLLLGGIANEIRLGSDNASQPLTPTNVHRRLETRYGSADIQPVTASNATLFVQQHRRKLREAAYSLEADGIVAPDLTIRSEHITRTPIARVTYQQEPDSLIWTCDDEGRQNSCVYQRDEEVVGWSRHPLPKELFLEDVSANPGVSCDELWGVLRYEHGGTVKRYICVQGKRFEGGDGRVIRGDPREDFNALDLSLTLDNTIDATLTPAATTGDGVAFDADAAVFTAGADEGRFIYYRYPDADDEYNPLWSTARARIVQVVSPSRVLADIEVDFPSTAPIAPKAWRQTVIAIAGLDHFEGREAYVSGDGVSLGWFPVVGGQADIGAAEDPGWATLHAGLPFVQRLMPMPFEAGAAEGSALGTRRRISRAAIFMVASARGFKLGRSVKLAKAQPDRWLSDPMGEAPALYTGHVWVQFAGTVDELAELLLIQDKPEPLTVTAIKVELENDE